MDPYNITQWRGRFAELVKRSQDIYDEHPEREDKVFGDVWNEWRYDPKNAEKVAVLINDKKSREYPRSTKAKIFTLTKNPQPKTIQTVEQIENQVEQDGGVKMSKSSGGFITMMDIKYHHLFEGRLFVDLTKAEQEHIEKIDRKIRWEKLSLWKKIKFLTPYLKFCRTYPLGLEVSLRFKDNDYCLFKINLVN